jgi:glycosyltransferase involved in cell wall biosynthesis
VTDCILEQGHTGFLFDTADEYVDSVNSLVADGTRRTEIGNRAREAVVERFDMRAVAEIYAEIYQRFAADASGLP